MYDPTDVSAGDCDYTLNDAVHHLIEAFPEVMVTIKLITLTRTTRVQLYAL